MGKPVVLLILVVGFIKGVWAQTCGDVPEKVMGLVAQNRIVLFGELHGTKEIPNYFANVVCHASKGDRKVEVGLEAPARLSELYQKYVDSREQVESVNKQIVNHDYWQSEFHDGRRSEAMFNLFSQIREFNLATGNISLFAFNSSEPDEKQHEFVSAKNVVDALKTNNDSVALILVGSRHSKVNHGNDWDPDSYNMGAFIKEKVSETVSVLFVENGGTTWVCRGECGVQELKPDPSSQPSGTVMPADEELAHEWVWHIGEVSASMPFKE